MFKVQDPLMFILQTDGTWPHFCSYVGPDECANLSLVNRYAKEQISRLQLDLTCIREIFRSRLLTFKKEKDLETYVEKNADKTLVLKGIVDAASDEQIINLWNKKLIASLSPSFAVAVMSVPEKAQQIDLDWALTVTEFAPNYHQFVLSILKSEIQDDNVLMHSLYNTYGDILIRAIGNNDVEIVCALLNSKYFEKVTGKACSRALFSAARQGKNDILSAFLCAKFFDKISTQDCWNVLRRGVRKNNELYSAILNLKQTAESFGYFLKEAIAAGLFELTQILLDFKDPSSNRTSHILSEDDYQKGRFFIAACTADLNTVESLLVSENIHLSNEILSSSFKCAVFRGNYAVAQAILSCEKFVQQEDFWDNLFKAAIGCCNAKVLQHVLAIVPHDRIPYERLNKALIYMMNKNQFDAVEAILNCPKISCKEKLLMEALCKSAENLKMAQSQESLIKRILASKLRRQFSTYQLWEAAQLAIETEEFIEAYDILSSLFSRKLSAEEMQGLAEKAAKFPKRALANLLFLSAKANQPRVFYKIILQVALDYLKFFVQQFSSLWR